MIVNLDTPDPDSVPVRDAATVMLVRDGAAGIEVFMLRRNLNSDFVGGAYVFPGGGVDPSDGGPEVEAVCVGRTDVEASKLLGVQQGGLAFWVAAIRESFEEAGVLLARHADGRRLLVGSDKSFDGSGAHPDLPRNGGSPRRALIGDKRNDENLIVSQLHATFLRFHNAVVDRLEHANVPASRLFDEAQRLVRWHYQWAILHDFLPAIVGDDMARAVREGDHGRPDLRLFRPVREAFMPVEFSAAAYRFGHSMVRPSYSLNTVARQATGGADVFHRIPIFSADAGPQANLNGFREIPDGWAVDWSFFFKGLPTPPGSDGLALPQPSYRMDTVLVDPLAALPEFAGGPADRAILAFRNLLRGWRLGLPSGQSVARFLGMTPLPDDLLFEDRAGFEGVNRHQVYTAYRSEFTRQAPLWYYLLKEAELTRRHDVPDPEGGGHHLGAVGGRIVAEVLVGLVWHDRHSYLRAEERWKPELVGDTFSLADLIRVAATAH